MAICGLGTLEIGTYVKPMAGITTLRITTNSQAGCDRSTDSTHRVRLGEVLSYTLRLPIDFPFGECIRLVLECAANGWARLGRSLLDCLRRGFPARLLVGRFIMTLAKLREIAMACGALWTVGKAVEVWMK